MEIIHTIIGHKLPYKWQIIHEIQLNKHFAFNINSIVIDDFNSYKHIDNILKYVDIENEKELKRCFKENSENMEKILHKNLRNLQHIFEQVVGPDFNEYFDSRLIYQMIKNDSFGKKQLVNFINYICEKANKCCKASYMPLDCWNKMLTFKVNVSLPSKDLFLNNFAEIIFKLINALKEQKTLHLNCVSLKILRTYLHGHKGIELERKEVFRCLKSGELKITNVVKCFRTSISNVKYVGTNSYDKIITIHRNVLNNLLVNIACETSIDNKTLPEFMVLDKKRLRFFQYHIKKLSTIASIWLLIQKIVDNNYFERIYLTIVEKFGEINYLNIIVDLIEKYKINKEVNIYKNISNCFKYEEKGIRKLIIKRISNFISSKENINIDKSIEKISSSLIILRKDFLVLANHYENVYLPVFNSIIVELS
jgi:hypothetical protein